MNSRLEMMPPGFKTRFTSASAAWGVRDVHQDGVAMGDIKGVVLKGKIGHIANVEGGVGVTAGRGGGPGQANLGLFHVYAVYLAGFHRPGQANRYGSLPAAEVENPQARLEMGN